MRVIHTGAAPSHAGPVPQAVEAGGWIYVSALFGVDPGTRAIPADARATGAGLLAAHHPQWTVIGRLALSWCTDPGQPRTEDVRQLLNLGDWLATRP